MSSDSNYSNSAKRRVVVTGIGALSPLGHDWQTVRQQLHSGRNVIREMHEWKDIEGLNTQLGCTVPHFDLPAHYNRKTMRSMGRVALMATRASELALESAGLLGHPLLKSGDMGVAYGSSAGTPAAIGDFGRMIMDRTTEGIHANTYIKMMSHTAAVNIGVFFGLTGRVITTSSACTSGSQGIGYAFEAIQSGKQIAMLAGGAEELDATQAAVFDTLFATSVKNDTPELTPRPFDAARDGLVLGEGACTFVLEELAHATARGRTSSPSWLALAPTATARTSPIPTRRRWRRPCGWPCRMPACRPLTLAMSMRMARRPSRAISPSRRPPSTSLATGYR